jgi:hypothetical protein
MGTSYLRESFNGSDFIQLLPKASSWWADNSQPRIPHLLLDSTGMESMTQWAVNLFHKACASRKLCRAAVNSGRTQSDGTVESTLGRQPRASAALSAETKKTQRH